MYAFFASERPAEFRAIHEKCHFSRPQFTIVASLRFRLRRSFVHWDSSCLYPALRAAGYVPMRPVSLFRALWSITLVLLRTSVPVRGRPSQAKISRDT